MQNKLFKRILSIALSLALLIAAVPMAVMNVSAASNVISDDFEGSTVNWIYEGATSVDNSTLVTKTNGETTNKVFFPKKISGAAPDGLGTSNIYLYNGTWPERKMTSVTGTLHPATVSPSLGSLIIVYYYKDADNWRGLNIVDDNYTSTAQNIRFCGKDEGKAVHFGTYARFYGATLNAGYDAFTVKNLDTSFVITYAANGTATIQFSNLSGTSPVLTLITGKASIGANTPFTSTISANEGQFALGNAGWADINNDYFDDITITFAKAAQDYANEFKTAHSAILSKTAATVTAEDSAAVSAALADYTELDEEVMALLTAEYALLSDMQDALVADSFNVNSFTETFDGGVFWERADVGATDDAASRISNGRFMGATKAYNETAPMPVYAHKYWPADKKLDTVSLDYYIAGTNVTNMMVMYYYKDANNWRGFWLQRGTSALNLRYHLMQSDPNDSNTVYYMWQNINTITTSSFTNGNIPDANSVVNLKLTYGEDNKVYLLITTSSGATYSTQLPAGSNYDSYAATTYNKDVILKSTDGGATFSAQTNSETGFSITHTFTAVESASGQFALGGCTNNTNGYADNITVNFELSNADKKAAFLQKHTAILSKTAETITAEDKAAIMAAVVDYEELDSQTQALLANEYALLLEMNEVLYASTMSGSSYTETFEGDYLWQQSGATTEESSLVAQENKNHVFAPAAATSTGYSSPTIYTHRYWPAKTLTSVTGTMYIGHTLTANSPSDVLIYSYQDENNWRGLHFNPANVSQTVRFVGMENGTPAQFAYYDNYTGGTLTTLENLETTFTITYNEDGTASMVLSNETGTSNTIPLCVIPKELSAPGYLKTINANYGAFGLGTISTASTGDWFDDITFNFGDTFEAKATEFKQAHAQALALEAVSVTTEHKQIIAAAYDAYNKIARSSVMATLLADEGAKIEALFKALIEAHKPADDGVLRIACVGDSITEGHQNNSISYPTQLQKIFDAKYGEGKVLVGNFGVSGATTQSYFSTALYKESLYFNADIVILKLGTNDVSNSLGVYKYYYEELADMYLANGVDTFVAATSIVTNGASHDGVLPNYRNAVLTLATENGWEYFDMYTATKDALLADVETNFKDKLHPTEAGYGILADAVYGYLTEDEEFDTEIDLSDEEFDEFEETFTLDSSTVSAESIEDIDAALALYDTLAEKQKEYYADAYATLNEIKTIAQFDKSVRDIAITPATIDEIPEIQADYEALGVQNASIEAGIAEKQEAINVFRPTTMGATVKTVADAGKQDLRYGFAAPTNLPTGLSSEWRIVSYGAIFLPEDMMIRQNQGLTIETDNIAHASIDLAEGETVPETFNANLGNSAVKDSRCSRAIAGTSYVVWSNGTDTYVYYAHQNNTSAEGGVTVRSVYSVARTIAQAIIGKEGVVYSEATVPSKDAVLEEIEDIKVLGFIVANLEVIKNL